MKTAAQLVVHSAPLHCQQRFHHHVERCIVARSLPVPQQEVVH